MITHEKNCILAWSVRFSWPFIWRAWKFFFQSKCFSDHYSAAFSSSPATALITSLFWHTLGHRTVSYQQIPMPPSVTLHHSPVVMLIWRSNMVSWSVSYSDSTLCFLLAMFWSLVSQGESWHKQQQREPSAPCGCHLKVFSCQTCDLESIQLGKLHSVKKLWSGSRLKAETNSALLWCKSLKYS